MTVELVIIQAVCVALTMWGVSGEPSDENLAFALILAFIPGIGYLIALAAVAQIIQRGFISKGKCILAHKYKNVTPVPKRLPMRVPVGGFDDYECIKCGNKTSVKWSAF